MRAFVVAWLWCASCGRFGFSSEHDGGGSGDGNSGDSGAMTDGITDGQPDALVDGSPDAASRVPCGNPLARVTTTGNAHAPTLIWNGSGYAVAWAEGTPSARFVRFDTSGLPVGSETIVSGSSANLVQPGLAWNGSGYAMVWSEGQNPSVRFQLLTTTGATSGMALRISPQATNSLTSLEMVYAATQYAFVWVADDALMFGRVDTAGAALGTNLAITSQLLGDPGHSLLWDGTNFWLEYTAHDVGSCPGFSWSIVHDRIDAMGTMQSTHTVDQWSAIGFSVCGEHVAVSTAKSSSGFADGYYRYDGQGGAGSLGVLDSGGVSQTNVPISGTASSPAVASSGSDYGTVWIDGTDLVFVRHSLAGVAMTPEYRIASGGVSSPAVVWNGTNYAITWVDTRDSTGGEIYFSLACP